MAYTGKTNWQNNEIVEAADMNRIEQGISDAEPIYDKVIRTQEEFNTLIASPNWLGAISVCFIGNGGTLKFTRNQIGIKIPHTVKQIQGMNSAVISISDFKYNLTTNKAGMWYETLPTTNDYSISDMIVECTGEPPTSNNGIGFHSCNQLTNCTSISTGYQNPGYGFHSCTQLTNCNSTARCTYGMAYGFHSCNQLINCKGSGIVEGSSDGYGFYNCSYLNGCKEGNEPSTTELLGGSNTKVDSSTVG